MNSLAYRFGLVGSITRDLNTSETGLKYEGLGGILYHAASLCGLGQNVRLLANVGQSLYPELEVLAGMWPEMDISRVGIVPGDGNRVHLHYPANGERTEILKSVVPPLLAGQILPCLEDLDFLIFVASSGMDISLEDWQLISRACVCPVWFDVHSLVLSRVVGAARIYRSFTRWKDWVEGARYVQANRMEAACMLSHPGMKPSMTELKGLARFMLLEGVRSAYITLGLEGVLTVSSSGERLLRPNRPNQAVDTTGCGDVFAAGTACRLAYGESSEEAASFGLELASEAASLTGVEQAYDLARRMGKKCMDPA